MNAQRVALIVLTSVNAVVLALSVAQTHLAAAQGSAAVLRGRALEIVDDRGRVRATISVLPAVTMNGKTYPETTLLRLIDPNGRPAVKIGASANGAGLGLAGASDPTYIVMQGDGDSTSLKMTNKDGRQHVIAP
ncbi:MAG: hypothetical protein JWO66_2013 [Candidatus Eremiobacteraeota bacterium]|jgi:hypothetical protein|nr:hypothetical protein [Candidatus Eremiobacteraeota bacterium]